MSAFKSSIMNGAKNRVLSKFFFEYYLLLSQMSILLQVQDYKDSLKDKAEKLIFKGFPEKIVKLNELLETPNFSNRSLSDVHQVKICLI